MERFDHGRVAGLLALPALLVAAAACDPGMDLEAEIRKKQLEDLGIESFDSTGSAPLAGVSVTRSWDLEPLDPRGIGADTTSSAYHTYLHRCGACHAAPSPAIETDWQWEATIHRMAYNIEKAGLLPLSEEEESVILEFLSRHALE